MITEKFKLLSIVIPNYNRQDSLIELLKQLSNSVVTRKLENDVEIIVIDDFSTSKINIPRMLVPIIYKTNKINLGPPLSRKIGFDISIGKFVHFHDSDDMITLNWLDSICTVLAERPETDLLLSARVDVDSNINTDKLQTYFHETIKAPTKISKRLIYRNCMGPLGGVTFSRQVLEKIEFKNMASCQDWQMYIDAIKHSKVLVSRPDIKFIFNKTGDDRISHNPRKKILGHLQLSRITSKESIFKRNIRLFYLYTCKQHIYNKGGSILKFYKKNRIKIFATFIVISLYWRLT